ncbi:MAG: nucleoside deaminase [Bacteroidales bacterium]|nr:nucleoside deaminase [Bacteroidales bacterium]
MIIEEVEKLKSPVTEDEKFMKEALKEARKAYEKDEIPVGAVIVCRGKIISRSHNLTELLRDPTAHAEMQAITMTTDSIGGKYLDECTLYVTLEPCPMCAAVLNWAQVKRVVYGAADPKRGFSLFNPSLLHPKCEVKEGICKEECSELLVRFFSEKRGNDV